VILYEIRKTGEIRQNRVDGHRGMIKREIQLLQSTSKLTSSILKSERLARIDPDVHYNASFEGEKENLEYHNGNHYHMFDGYVYHKQFPS
jgi:hypothetical protein